MDRQTLESSPTGQFLIQVSPKTDDVNNLGAESAAFALLGPNLTRFDEDLGTYIYVSKKQEKPEPEHMPLFRKTWSV